MSASQTNSLFLAGDLDQDLPTGDDRLFVLADLIALGKIWIKIILAREDRNLADLSVNRETEFDRCLDRAAIQDRENSGKRDVHCACVGVGRRAEIRRRSRKNLRFR